MRNPTNIHIQGVLGEYAFAQLCNARWSNDTKDTKQILNNTKSRSGRADTFDWSLFGQTIDVKTTLNQWSKRLFARTHKFKYPADWYVLILLEFKDPKTKQTIHAQTKQYDMYIDNLETYEVQATFKGAITSRDLFTKEHQVDPAQFAAEVMHAESHAEWTTFCEQFNEADSCKKRCDESAT